MEGTVVTTIANTITVLVDAVADLNNIYAIPDTSGTAWNLSVAGIPGIPGTNGAQGPQGDGGGGSSNAFQLLTFQWLGTDQDVSNNQVGKFTYITDVTNYPTIDPSTASMFNNSFAFSRYTADNKNSNSNYFPVFNIAGDICNTIMEIIDMTDNTIISVWRLGGLISNNHIQSAPYPDPNQFTEITIIGQPTRILGLDVVGIGGLFPGKTYGIHLYKVNSTSGGGGGSQGPQGYQGDSQAQDAEQSFSNTIYDISFSAATGNRYIVDTSANGPLTATLPEFPNIGNAAFFVDGGRSFGINNFTVQTDPNAGTPQTINNAPFVTVSTTGQSIGTVYIGNNKWITYNYI
jgi:hypothetical protein